MKKLFLALFVFLALPGASAAQTWRLAVDYCYNYWYLEDYEIHCYISVRDPDGWGSGAGPGFSPSLSPDGKRLAFVTNVPFDALAPTNVIVVVNLEDGIQTTITDSGSFPVAWSADSQRIAFVSSTSTGTAALNIANADGTGLIRVPTGTALRWYPTWSRDGRLAFSCEVCSSRSPEPGQRPTLPATYGRWHAPRRREQSKPGGRLDGAEPVSSIFVWEAISARGQISIPNSVRRMSHDGRIPRLLS